MRKDAFLLLSLARRKMLLSMCKCQGLLSWNCETYSQTLATVLTLNATNYCDSLSLGYIGHQQKLIALPAIYRVFRL